MYTSIPPAIILNNFNNSLNYQKATELCSPCLVRCIRFIITRTQKHNSIPTCFGFKCSLVSKFINILCYRRHAFLLSFINDRKNKVLMSDQYLHDFFRKLRKQLLVPSSI